MIFLSRFAARRVQPLLLALFATTMVPTALANDINSALQGFVTQGVPNDREITALLQREYSSRRYEPLWIGANELSLAGQQALNMVQRSEQLGVLRDYASNINPNVGRYDYTGLARLDYQLTVSMLRLLTDVSEGHIAPIVDDSEWQTLRSRKNTMRRLSKELQTRFLDDLLSRESPPRPEYTALLRELDRYNRIVERGGWPQLPADSPTLKPDMINTYVPLLRQRLQAEGFVFVDNPQFVEHYDESLLFAVRRFQINNGLNPDGIIGPNTRKVLNITASQRREQLLVNLERMRWLPEDLGERYLWVNIPNYRLTIYDQQEPTLDMAVIVGRRERPTPVFYDRIEYLEVNPYWNIPDSIAYKDYLPKIMQDVGVLERDQIKVRENWRKNAAELDPYAIDWLALFPEYAYVEPGLTDDNEVIDVDAAAVEKPKQRRFPFHLRQEPGPHNSLGRVKFMFPNEHYVYLHDTPKQYLFNRGKRAFSSGCVRVSNPSKLAQFLIDTQQVKFSNAMSLTAEGNTVSDTVQYEDILATGENQQLSLKQPLPVYLVYQTAWVDQQGRLQFRDDIYGRDKNVAAQLALVDKTVFTQSKLMWAGTPKMFQPPKKPAPEPKLQPEPLLQAEAVGDGQEAVKNSAEPADSAATEPNQPDTNSKRDAVTSRTDIDLSSID